MVWGCFAASGPGRLAIIEGTMNSKVFQDILQENDRPAVYDLKRKRGWMMQQDNDPKHTSKSSKEWLKRKICVLEWTSQSPDLNSIEMLWHDLKRAVQSRQLRNIDELKQIRREEWLKIPPQRCASLLSSYRKRSVEVVAAKGRSTSY